MTARSPTMVTLHDTQFVECRWWNDGWTMKTVVTRRSLASMIPAPGCCCWLLAWLLMSCTTPHHTYPHHTTPRHTTPRHTTPRHTTSHHTTPRHTYPHHTTPHHTTQHKLQESRRINYCTLRYFEGTESFSFILCLLVKIDIYTLKKKSVNYCSVITGYFSMGSYELLPQQHDSVSQRRICADTCTCCHTEI